MPAAKGQVHTPDTQLASPADSTTVEVPRSIEHIAPIADLIASRPSGALTRLQELELMHHYVTRTAETTTHGEEDIDIWRIAIPHEAAQHEFLMDGLLAVTALHVAHLRPSKSEMYAAAAMYYQNRGLRHYQPALLDITDDNCRAMFAFGMILSTITLAVANGAPDGPNNSARNTVITMFHLVRGNTMVVVDQSQQALLSSAFGPIFTLFDRRVDSAVPEDVTHNLDLLRQRVHASAADTEPGRRRMFISAVDCLEQDFRKVDRGKSLSAVMGWPVVIDHAMIDLLAQQDPIVQLIFATYGVLLLCVHDVWYGKDFGLRLIRQMSESLHSLGPEWVPWTAWAREKAALIESSAIKPG
ncbi:hypothetical protein LTR85_012030 [Meristemomyces frigidus]|nr:hypothetical protein LTR85_012030 [Meristemomyces frigidus]